MDVSYGVDKPEDSAELVDKPKKKVVKKRKKSTKKTSAETVTKKKESAEEEKPVKKPSLIEQINEMKASGDVNSPEFREKMAKLEVILGIDEISLFGTNELDVFEDKISGMTYADMRDMAARVGLNPFLPHQRMKAALLQEFKDQNKNNMRNAMPGPSQVIDLDPNNPKHAEALKILGEI